MKLNSLIAYKLKKVRTDQHIAAEAVANYLKIHPCNYSKLENGRTKITIEKLEALSKFFNVPLKEFLPEDR